MEGQECHQKYIMTSPSRPISEDPGSFTDADRKGTRGWGWETSNLRRRKSSNETMGGQKSGRQLAGHRGGDPHPLPHQAPATPRTVQRARVLDNPVFQPTYEYPAPRSDVVVTLRGVGYRESRLDWPPVRRGFKSAYAHTP